MWAEQQIGGFGIAPFDPRKQARAVLLALGEKSLSRDRIESVGEIRFQKNSRWAVFVALALLAGGLVTDFSAQRLGHANL